MDFKAFIIDDLKKIDFCCALRLFSFNKILLFIKKLAFDGFYPILVEL